MHATSITGWEHRRITQSGCDCACWYILTHCGEQTACREQLRKTIGMTEPMCEAMWARLDGETMAGRYRNWSAEDMEAVN
eukprot:2190733-Karenia_brevis.AAC.1